MPARVTVTTWPEPAAVAVQLENPGPSVTDGEAGTTYPAAKVTVTVSLAERAPTAVGVNPTVQRARAPPVWGNPVKDALVTTPAPIATGRAGDPLPVSALVVTVK